MAGTSTAIGNLRTGTTYQVQVRATSLGGSNSGWSPSGTGTTGNAAPAFASDTATRSFPENTAAGVNIGTPVTATDADAGDTRTYRLGGTDAASFAIVEATGQLRTGSGVTYDFETDSSYTVTVEVSDGTDTDTITVTITLTDVGPPAKPAAPTFGQTTSTSIEVHWLAPESPGADITDYDVQYREGTSGSFTSHDHTGTATTTTLTGLTADQSHEVQVAGGQCRGRGRVVGLGHRARHGQRPARLRRGELPLHPDGE